MNIKKFKTGQKIFQEGEAGTSLYQIINGKVSLSKTKGSDLIEIDELSKGDYLGLSSKWDTGKENATVTAISDVSIQEVPIDSLKFVQTNAKVADLAKMFQFLSKSLHSQNEKIKKLQYFDKLHFDRYQKDEISLYHLKDILRMSWVLLLCFNRYNFSISRDFFEDLSAILIADMRIKPEQIIDLYLNSQVIVEDEKTGNLSLINVDKLEFFSHFLLQNFIKQPRKLLLNKSSREIIKHILTLKNDRKIFREDAFGFHVTFKHELIKACDHIPNASLLIERLIDKGFFKKEFDEKGEVHLSCEFYTFEEIMRCYEIIEKFSVATKN